MAHDYINDIINRAIEKGVKSMEHGNLIDETTLQMMKDKGVWLSLQLITVTNEPIALNEEKIGFEKIVFGSDSARRWPNSMDNDMHSLDNAA